jgi:hypothetical protein
MHKSFWRSAGLLKGALEGELTATRNRLDNVISRIVEPF